MEKDEINQSNLSLIKEQEIVKIKLMRSDQQGSSKSHQSNHPLEKLDILTIALKETDKISEGLIEQKQKEKAKIFHFSDRVASSMTRSHMFSINFTREIIQKQEAYRSKNTFFLYPYCCILTYQLLMISKNEKLTFLYQQLQTMCKIIHELSQQSHPQINQDTLRSLVVDCFQYQKRRGDKKYYLEQAKKFLKQHETVMNIYMPLYWKLFFFLVNFEEIFQGKQISIQVAANEMKQIERSTLHEHHSHDI